MTAQIRVEKGREEPKEKETWSQEPSNWGNARNISRKGNNGGKWFNAHDAQAIQSEIKDKFLKIWGLKSGYAEGIERQEKLLQKGRVVNWEV